MASQQNARIILDYCKILVDRFLKVALQSLKDDFFACLLQMALYIIVAFSFTGKLLHSFSWFSVSQGRTMSMLKVWSEDERLYLDYEDEDEFFLVTDIDYE